MPKSLGTERIRRLVELQEHFIRKNKISIKELEKIYLKNSKSEKTQSALRAIQRDVAFMKDIFFINIERIDDFYVVVKKNVVPEEAEKVHIANMCLGLGEIKTILAGTALVKHLLPHFEEEVNLITEKMSSLLGNIEKKEVEALASLYFAEIPVPQIRKEYFDILAKAIKGKKMISFWYHGLASTLRSARHYKVLPHAIFFRHNTWNVWAEVIGENREREFRINSIKKLGLLDEGKEETAMFRNLETVATYSEKIEISVIVDQELVDAMKQLCWLPDGWRVEDAPEKDGKKLAFFKVNELRDAVDWIFGCTPHALPASPLELVHLVEQMRWDITERIAKKRNLPFPERPEKYR